MPPSFALVQVPMPADGIQLHAPLSHRLPPTGMLLAAEPAPGSDEATHCPPLHSASDEQAAVLLEHVPQKQWAPLNDGSTHFGL